MKFNMIFSPKCNRLWYFMLALSEIYTNDKKDDGSSILFVIYENVNDEINDVNYGLIEWTKEY